jgi:hypothetical protein
MFKMLSITGSLSVLALSVGTAMAASGTTTTPSPQPTNDNNESLGQTTLVPPQSPPPVTFPPDGTSRAGEPGPMGAPAPLPGPSSSPLAAPGPDSPSMRGADDRDGRDDQYVERGFGKALPASVVGAGLLVGGGVQDFSRSNARGVTNAGGFWNARLVAGTREYIGLEGAYIGSAQGINALGLDSDAVLISNGVEGAVRLNLPIVVARSATLLEPFVFGGAGWSRFHVARSSVNTSDIASDDDVLTVPYGAGMMVASRGLMADARFTYRSTFYNDLLRTTGGSLDNWSAGAQVGFEF